MRRRKTRGAWVLGFPLIGLLLMAGAAEAHGEGPGVVKQPVTYYVHDFTDAAQKDFKMSRAPLSGGTPQEGTCLECAGDPAVVYNFTADDAFRWDTDVSEDPGVFVFWIRAWQVAPGVAVPPLETRVSFTLRVEPSGSLLGSGDKTITITDAAPQEFRASFTPALGSISAGSHLRWSVSITGPQKVYLPLAAPYGSTDQFPFQVQFTQIAPTAIELEPASIPETTIEAGGGAQFGFVLHNDGGGPETVTLGVTGVPSGASAQIEDAEGTPVASSFVVPGDEEREYTLTVSGLPLGNHSLSVTFETRKGQMGDLDLTVHVAQPTPTPLEKKGGNVPGFEAALGLAALGFAFARRRRGNG